jgi:exosortase A-associated hydrolase 2
MTNESLAGEFIAGRAGPLFVLRRGSPTSGRCVLVVPPFAEEMNKSRRMVALASIRLAAAGVVTVMPDLYGTGDSGGDFADADWELWRDDVVRTVRWCDSRVGPVTGVLAVRLGCALACDEQVLAAMPALSRTVFWQPVLDGSRFLAQFLRLRVAASMANDVRESVADLRRALSVVGEIEVAGYRVPSGLAGALDEIREPPVLPVGLGVVEWFELVRENGLPVAPSSSRLIQASVAAGLSVAGHSLLGEPFWAATEIVTNDELVRATVDVFTDPGSTVGSGPT